jgi:hypothetical protein
MASPTGKQVFIIVAGVASRVVMLAPFFPIEKIRSFRDFQLYLCVLANSPKTGIE